MQLHNRDSTDSSTVAHISPAFSLLPRVHPVTSFTHPLIFLLNEYPMVWPYVSCILEAWLKERNDLQRFERSVSRMAAEEVTLQTRNSLRFEEIQFIVLDIMLRAEWPIEHALLRMRINQLLLSDFSRWRSLINLYTRWLPGSVPSVHLLQLGQLLSDNLGSLGGLSSLVAALVFLRDAATKKDADFSFVIFTALQIASNLKEGDQSSHPCVTLLLCVLLTTCGRLYGLLLLELARILFYKRLLPGVHHLALSLCHSAVAGHPTARKIILDIKNEGYGDSKDAYVGFMCSKSLRTVPSDLLPSLMMYDDDDGKTKAAVPRNIPSSLRGLLVAGKVVACAGPQLPSWIRILKALCCADSNNSCLAFFAIGMRLDAEMFPKNIFSLLESLPHIATSKMSAVLIRNMLIAMWSGGVSGASAVSLSSLAVVLLSRLYVRHNALILPTLLRVISSGSEDVQPSLALAVAKAQAIKTVIQHSPWLHGCDMLPWLCRLMTVRSPEMTAIFPLCLDGVRTLIECKVVTLSSFIEKFSECFFTDSRPQVRAAFYELIGHSILRGTSEGELIAYQRKLWVSFFDQNEHNIVRASCLDALAYFPEISIAALPEKEVCKLRLTLEFSSLNSSEEGSLAVPASFFTVGPVANICSHSNSALLQKAFSNFISTRIRHEVRCLPRSAITVREVHQSSRSIQQIRTYSSSLAQIPRLQQSLFHQNAHDIQPQAAAGLLLTYNPPVKTDQGGAASKNAMIQHSNSFLAMFRSLLETVPLFNAKEWFMSLTCLPQWHLLVERAFVSLTNARKAESGSNEQSKLLASLWARDQLSAVAAEVGSGNGLIAICSLVSLTYEYEKTLKLKERLQMDSQHLYNILGVKDHKYLSHAEWPVRALRSLLCLIQRRPIDDAYFAQLLAKFTRSASSTEKAIGAILFSLHQMLPLLQSQGLLRDALKCFSIKAQHQEFLAAVGAGLMIQKCMFHGIFEVAEDVRRICEDIVQKLEAWALDGKSGTVTSPSYLFGTTLAMSSLCALRMFQSPARSFCARIVALLGVSSPLTLKPTLGPVSSGAVTQTRQPVLSSSSSDSRWTSHENDFDYLDEIALCCAVMAINGRQFVLKSCAGQDRYGNDGDVGEQKSLRDLAEWLTQRRAQVPMNAGVAIALGLILHNMAQCDAATKTLLSQQRIGQLQDQITGAHDPASRTKAGHIESHRLVEALLTKVWLPVVANAHESNGHKIAAVEGIAALTGALDHLIVQSAELPDRNVWCESNVLTHDVTLTLLDAMIRDVNTMPQNVSNTATLKAHHIWTLGLFHRALTRTCGVDPVASYPPILNLGSNDRASSLLAETVTAADKDMTAFGLLVDGLGQSFDSPLPCFAWIQLRQHLYNRGTQGAQIQRALVILAVENAKLTPSLVPLLEAIISSAVLDVLEEFCKNFLLDRLRLVLEVCDPSKIGPFLSLYKDQRVNSEDIQVAEEAWKLLASYLENSAANSTLVYLIQEMICYALPSCKARHYVAACLINFRDVTLRDLILKSLLAQEKLTLKRALELRMTLAGVIEMADVENPFTFIGAMSNSEFTEFSIECASVNCAGPVVENSVKWLLEILPRGQPSCRSLTLLSLIANMMIQPSDWEDGRIEISRTEQQIMLLLPYRIDQMMRSKIWGTAAVEHILQWLISVLENTSPSNDTYAVLHDTLMALRDKPVLRNNRTMWTRAVKLTLPSSI
ncbi:uncharacterized protein LOC111269937 isoform X2 [Varroa jacobsoni]|uniref:uncharacterized protein LOC111269937 isoform X2 n=1 Tax=Varroa jacobsoni TaxID=62625 RepID=UPI000BF6A250|nr:uncharacterized protein LOC111269937 isoform X2 [Varroa jacobsoni]